MTFVEPSDNDLDLMARAAFRQVNDEALGSSMSKDQSCYDPWPADVPEQQRAWARLFVYYALETAPEGYTPWPVEEPDHEAEIDALTEQLNELKDRLTQITDYIYEIDSDLVQIARHVKDIDKALYQIDRDTIQTEIGTFADEGRRDAEEVETLIGSIGAAVDKIVRCL